MLAEGVSVNKFPVLAKTRISEQEAAKKEQNVYAVTEAEYDVFVRSDKGFLMIKDTSASDSDKYVLKEDSMLAVVTADGQIREISNKDGEGNILFDTVYRKNTVNSAMFLVGKDNKKGLADEFGNYTDITEQMDLDEDSLNDSSVYKNVQNSDKTLTLTAKKLAEASDYYDYDSEKNIIVVYDEVKNDSKTEYKFKAMYDCSGDTAVSIRVNADNLYLTKLVKCKGTTEFVEGYGVSDGTDSYALKEDGTLVRIPLAVSVKYAGVNQISPIVIGKWLGTDMYYMQKYSFTEHNYSYDLFNADNNYIDTVKSCIVEYIGYDSLVSPDYIVKDEYAVNSYGYAVVNFSNNQGRLYGINSGMKQSDLNVYMCGRAVVQSEGKGLIVYSSNDGNKYGCALIKDISNDKVQIYESMYAGYTGVVEAALGKRYISNGIMLRNQEICDKETGKWSWIESDGTYAKDKFVFIPYNDERTEGKWVYYNGNCDMVKGAVKINSIDYMFDQITGEAYNLKWADTDGVEYWYENGIRQGLEGRGKEIYDPSSEAWYWLDAIDGGRKAVSKDVYLESGDKWVRYDAKGHMIKGWDTNEAGTYYFDKITGAMQKGYAVIDGQEYYFDTNTGIMK